MSAIQCSRLLAMAGYHLLALASDVAEGRVRVGEVPARVLALVGRWL